jgi:zinc protease
MTDGNVTVASVHGMRVIVERVAGAEFAVSRLAIRGGVRNWTPERAGVELVALNEAVGGGTRSLSKEQLARKLSSLGASLDVDARADFSDIIGLSPKASFDDTFTLLADTFLTPALPESEFTLARERALSARRHEMEDGDGRLTALERRTIFAGHPYASREDGSVETLGALTPDAVAAHLAKLRETSRLVLVVVGDVEPSHVFDRARAAFASVPRGDYAEAPLPPLRFDASRAVGDAHHLATNYIGSFFVAPAWKDPDYVAARVAVDVLSHRVWEEVRAKRNLSYAPWAVYRRSYGAPYAGFYVSAVDPTTTMKVMMDEARKLESELTPADELGGIKATQRTRYAQSRETVESESGWLLEGELYAGDWRFVRRYGDAVAAVTPEQIRDVAKKYMTTAWQTVIVGDPDKLSPAVVGASAIGH